MQVQSQTIALGWARLITEGGRVSDSRGAPSRVAFSKQQALANFAKFRFQRLRDGARGTRAQQVRYLGEQLARRAGSQPSQYAGPAELSALRQRYQPAEHLQEIPLVWWTHSPNYGDLMSPWLVGLMTGRQVIFADPHAPHYMGIGSIANQANKRSVVWGSGLNGSELKWLIRPAAQYRAVRGPLTRTLLRNIGLPVPRVYGDPALLLPVYYYPAVAKESEIGLVIRWSEDAWRGVTVPEGVRIIDLGSPDVVGTTNAILSCRRIISSALHGLVIADAYGIPSAWLSSDSGAGGSRPSGGEFKFYDYMLSVQKVRPALQFEPSRDFTSLERTLERIAFDERPIEFDHAALLDASPFVARLDGVTD